MYCMYFVHIVCMLWYILCISLLYCMYCLYFLQPKVLVGRYAQHTYNTYIYIHIHTTYIANTYKNTCKYMHIHAFYKGVAAIHIVCMCMYLHVCHGQCISVCMYVVCVCICVYLFVCALNILLVHIHSKCAYALLWGVQSAPFAPPVGVSYAFRAWQSCLTPHLS